MFGNFWLRTPVHYSKGSVLPADLMLAILSPTFQIHYYAALILYANYSWGTQ
jgi:hypothetical protein